MRCGFCKSELIKELTLRNIILFDKIIFNECCLSCYAEFESYDINELKRCKYCKKKSEKEMLICKDCELWVKNIKNFSLKHDYLYEYNEQMKEYFQRYKFSGDIQMGNIFRKDLFDKISFYQKNEFIIIPIPLSKERISERGFNQVEVLLQSSQINYESVLLKKEDSQAQSQKNREERLCTEQPFCLKKGGKRVIHKRKVLIIDDVYTTGRTILHAYDCVSQAKPSEICSFSLTR